MKKIFIDSDIILDFLGEREFFHDAFNLFALLDNYENVKGYTTSNIIANIYYVSRKAYAHSEIITRLKDLKRILKIIPIDDKIIDQAIDSHFIDFEDAIQYYSALKYNVDAIITRNISDYKLSKIKVMTAGKFLSSYFK